MLRKRLVERNGPKPRCSHSFADIVFLERIKFKILSVAYLYKKDAFCSVLHRISSVLSVSHGCIHFCLLCLSVLEEVYSHLRE